MVIKSSGPLGISEIAAEFGGAAPHALSEYYRGGVRVPDISQNANVPTSGSIAISNFYGAQKLFIFTITENLLQVNLRNYLISNGWNGTDRAVITLASNRYLWSDNTSVAGLTTGSFPGGLTFTNNGFIIGKGGAGGLGGGTAAAGVRKNGLPGGPALSAGANFTLINNGYIAGGGGGGAAGTSRQESGGEYVGSGAGGGAGGGEGGSGSSRLSNGITVEGSFLYAGGAGGAIGQAGSNGVGAESIVGGSGGGAGGSGAAFNQQNFETDDFGGGGGGGRILPGTGGVSSQGAGNGGSANSVGANSSGTFGAGGGGWGAAGGNNGTFSGGAGGAAIVRNGFTVTVQSGSERIWGAIT